MIKKLAAVLLTLLIAFLWVVTVSGVGPLGPLSKHMKLGLDISGGVYVVMEAQTGEAQGSNLSTIMNQSQSILEQRVNALGVSEAVVTVEGRNRIRVEMPGVQNAQEAISAIGRVAQLQFLLADGSKVMDGTAIRDAGVDANRERGGYVVTLNFTGDGQKAFYDGTTKAYAKSITSDQIMKASDGAIATDTEGNQVEVNSIVIKLDDEIISAPVVNNGPINDTSCIIEGTFTADEARNLAMLIRGGALPVELKEVESSEIGATLGMGALEDAILAGVIGIGLIMLLFLGMYRLLGLAANLAIMLYIPAILWLIVAIGGVLTLPGIAGIILSIGMAVDCNVIIFARIKEEVGHGKTIRVAVSTGFRRAMGTIVDAQLTTIIAAVILYVLGTGPVRGFALTLIIGIVIGVAAAVLATHLYVAVFTEIGVFVRSSFLIALKEGAADQHNKLKRTFNFIRHRKTYYIVTVAILVVGLAVGLIRGYNFGIDFTGGTVMQLNMHKKVSEQQVQEALRQHGVNDADIIAAGADGNSIIIKTTKNLVTADREKVVDTFKKEFGISDDDMQSFEQFGPSIGDMLKKNAIIATLIAAACMLIYIAIRFRWRLGVAALAGVFHDVIIMIALYGLFHMTINNPFIAAILTIVGYSINDTIVIFDRIRENLGIMSRAPTDELIDASINQTLVRSLLTSASTALAIIPLIILGGDSIRQFTIPLLIGIICGAASSIFISSPIYYELTKIGDGGRRGGGRSGKYVAASGKGGDSTAGVKGHGKKSKSKRSGDQRKPGDGAVV